MYPASVMLLILITTSHRPTQRMRTLCNDLQRVLPNAVRINRGKLNVEGIYEKAFEMRINKVIIIERRKGGPGNIKLYTLPLTSQPFAVLSLIGVKLQDEVGRRKAIREGLIVTTEKNALPSVKHLAGLFSKFLSVPLLDEPNASFKASMHFSSLQEGEVKISFTVPPIGNDIGPILVVRSTDKGHRGETHP